ncbi:radical SAM family heme chaperone HemW [Enorma massiliensis]|uniref:radical SAM family heme chaperone HemW n=1 Tax=Enorma massiliensis TaxID=1472761 RepID=UPI0032081517
MAVEALYLHIPFCRARCAYCDFDTCALDPAAFKLEATRYLAALERRIDEFGARGMLASVRTVYIGGGTPTVLGERLPGIVRRVCAWCAPEEFTCEANPESFHEELAGSLAASGVTRISLGVQSLEDDELSAIGRIHTATAALEAIELARREGFSVSCDLMCGLPGQHAASWRRTLERALAAHPDHISVYPLTVEAGTPLADRVARNPSLLPDEDFQADCMEVARSLCEGAGLAPYEVASYARPGHACRHNIAYWSGVSYLGLGRSAASMMSVGELCDMASLIPGASPSQGDARARFVQADDPARTFEFEFLSEREALAEDLMLAMRMTAGAPPDLIGRAQDLFGARFDQVVEMVLAEGLACIDSATGALVPTARGWLMGNELYGLMWGLAEA